MAEATETTVDGRYRIVGRIGSGGMADVYRAEDRHLARDVALKVLHRRFAQDEQFVERFRREASSAASLQHPNVVSVYDRGEHDGTYYIAMECLPGRTLKELAAEEAPLAQERSIDLGIQILQAAGFAHGRGVVHRDFKPQNVIVDDRDEVKVTDFGIARAGASDITETGSILGTAQYLSPEQAQGGGVEASSDIYSIGVILYELLAGRLPFEGHSAVAVAVKHLTEEPPRLAELRPDIHPGLEAAVMRALAKDPRERWGSAEEFVSALQAARAQIAMGDAGQGTAVWAPLPIDGGPEEPEPPDARRGRLRPRRRWWLIAAALLLLAALAAFLLLRTPNVAVPDLVGEQRVDAEAALEDAGLEVEVEEEKDQAPLNEVIDQDPDAEVEVDEGSTVTLVVSSGPGQTEVPDVVGLTEKAAIRKLNDAGFRTDSDRQFSSEVEEGLVIETLPPAGTERTRGSSVQVLVSDGARQVEVPNVVGESRDGALGTLEAQGFVVDVVEIESDSPADQVVDQSPAGGTVVDEGSTVEISVSTGPPPEPTVEMVTVPGVVGLSADAASSQLSAAGLDVATTDETTEDEGEDGVVLSQSPGGGAEVEEGTTVTIVVGRFEEPREEVPPPEDPPGGGEGPPDGGEPPGGGGGPGGGGSGGGGSRPRR